MKLNDLKAFVGHQVHVCRYREAGTLLDWMGEDLRGKRVLDVAGGDGYWAGQAVKRGAEAVSIDLARSKMLYGQTLAFAPALACAEPIKLKFAVFSPDSERLFNTVITKSIRLEESPAYKESIFTFAPKSSGAMEYYSLSEEILSRVS